MILASSPNSLWPAISSIHTIVFDFDGVFTNNKVYVDQNGIESVCCDRADGLGIDMLREAMRLGWGSFELIIISTERNPVVEARAKKLGLRCCSGVKNKLSHIRTILSECRPNDMSPETGLVFLGNDLNDLSMMNYSGFSVAPIDAHELVKKMASVVLPNRGGEGFVRAFVENFLQFNSMSMEALNEFICHR